MKQIDWSDQTLHLLEEFEHEREERAYKQQWSHDQAVHQPPRPVPLERRAAYKHFGKVATGVAAINMMRTPTESPQSQPESSETSGSRDGPG